MLSNYLVSWEEAKEACLSMGRILLEPRSAQKYTDAVDYRWVAQKEIWLGASDLDEEDKWEWASDCEAVSSDAGWYPGEPNNFRNEEHCMVMWPNGFVDTNCDRRLPFVCDGQ